MTAVESGSRALQYLGLDGERSSVGFDVRISSFPTVFFGSMTSKLKLGSSSL